MPPSTGAEPGRVARFSPAVRGDREGPWRPASATAEVLRNTVWRSGTGHEIDGRHWRPAAGPPAARQLLQAGQIRSRRADV